MKNYDEVFTKQFVDKLIGSNTGKAKEAERFLLDTAVWYLDNGRNTDINNIGRRLELACKCNEMFLNIFALMLKRIQELENKPKHMPIFLPGRDF